MWCGRWVVDGCVRARVGGCVGVDECGEGERKCVIDGWVCGLAVGVAGRRTGSDVRGGAKTWGGWANGRATA